jgi:integrase
MARSKRSNGERSLYHSEALDTWVAEIVLPDGREKRKKNKHQRVVREWLDVQREAVRRGSWISNETVKYGDFLDRYMRDVAAHTLRPKSLENYNYAIKNRIKPALGDKRIVSIRPEHLHTLYSKLLEEGLEKSSVKYIHAVVRKTLGTAFEWGLVSRNVAEAATPPPADSPEIRPLTVDEVKRLLKVLEDDYLYAYYLLIATTGIRKSEGLALQKSDLRLEEGVVIVRHSLSHVHGKGLILGEPKSQKSKRELALPAFTVEVLRRYLKDHPNDSNFVFTTRNGTPISPVNILKHFKRKTKESGLPQETRLHDLRHSFISWLGSAGVPIRDLQEIAGHAQASTTLKIYSHVLPGYNQEAAKKIEGLFNEKR